MTQQGAVNDRDIVVAGYGPVGRAVVEMLHAWNMRVTVVDINSRDIAAEDDKVEHFVCGDISDEAVLREARVDRADALVLTVPDEEAVVQACRLARQMNDHIFIAARANYLSKGMLATQAGADHVTVEEVVTAREMQNAVIRKLVD